jgi:hypothetical protein
MNFDPLGEQLKLLAKELQKENIKIILGGGYGLVLKTEHIRGLGAPTRFAEIPETRSTNDLDLFLSAEIITSREKTEKIRNAIEKLGFVPLAKYFQFKLPLEYEGLSMPIKIDLLAAAPKTDEARKLVKINKPRIRPHGAEKIHGFLTEEAVTLEEHLLPINISTNKESLEIYLPHPFSYLVMKLFALRDRLEDESKDSGAYHAFDIYRIVALMTEEEWEQSVGLYQKYAEEPKIKEATEIVGQLFEATDSIGILRVRQHAQAIEITIPEANLRDLTEDLQDLFK